MFQIFQIVFNALQVLSAVLLAVGLIFFVIFIRSRKSSCDQSNSKSVQITTTSIDDLIRRSEAIEKKRKPSRYKNEFSNHFKRVKNNESSDFYGSIVPIKEIPNKPDRNHSYRLSVSLMTPTERSFYGVLVKAVSKNDLIFSKVRVADIMNPVRGLSRSDWQRAFNSISCKHFDFVICDKFDLSFKYVIELDDASHKNQQKRDQFKNEICESANLPLIRIIAKRGYSVTQIKEQIESYLTARPY